MNDMILNKDVGLVAPASVPLTVPEVSINETMEQFRNRWAKVDKLRPEKKTILSSDETISQIENLQKSYQLNYEETCDFSRLIRALVFRDIPINKIDFIIQKKIPKLSQNLSEIKNIINDILFQKPVLENKDEQETKTISNKIQLTIQEALQQYPDAGEQDLTLNPLKLKYFANSVRPSIKNWITDFHDNMGAGKHSAIDRGNYLFHSENGKKLTPVERQKLSAILKSLDEKTPISFNPESKKIIFQNEELASGVNPGSYGMQSKQGAESDIESVNRRLEKAALAEDNYFQIPKKETLHENSGFSPNFVDEPKVSFLSKQKNESTPQGNFKDFSSAGGKLSFSSPHKFPNEQSEETAENDIFQNAQRKTPIMPPTNKIAYSQKQPQSQTYRSIKPSSPYKKEPIEDDQAFQPKIKGNVVDLREIEK